MRNGTRQNGGSGISNSNKFFSDALEALEARPITLPCRSFERVARDFPGGASEAKQHLSQVRWLRGGQIFAQYTKVNDAVEL